MVVVGVPHLPTLFIFLKGLYCYRTQWSMRIKKGIEIYQRNKDRDKDRFKMSPE